MITDEIIKKESALELPSGSAIAGYAYIRGYSEQPDRKSTRLNSSHRL